MIKLKASEKELKNKAHYIISLGYCQAPSLLYFIEPFSYTAGVYGWNSDNYNIDNYNGIISTGYRPLNDKNINVKIKNDIINNYELKAEEIKNSNVSYEVKKESINNLLNLFINEVIKG